jgi:hypothetical protein
VGSGDAAQTATLTSECDITGCMIRCVWLLCLLPVLVFAAPEWVLIRMTDGTEVEGQANLAGLNSHGSILSFHSGGPASDVEKERITAGLVAIQGKDRQGRDAAVEELTAIGVPVLTPLLTTLKDTDQHEPRPLYRLFERIMPSNADGLDRTLSILRLENGTIMRVAVPSGSIDLKKSDGSKSSVPWASIRTLAVRKKLARRTMPIHSLRHCTQIEYLDTGIVVTPKSKVDLAATGFVRLSWNEDGWASDPDGLKKPGSPAYKTNLVDGQPFGALVGRVGSKNEKFLVGKKLSKTNLPEGRLELAINDNGHWQNNLGEYTVTLTATDAYDLGDAQ